MIVPRTLTPLTRPELRVALLVGYRAAFEADPSYGALGVAWAQQCIEHANGAALWCHNFGNVDAIPEWEGDVFELTAAEVLNGKRVMMTKKLCAHATAEAGAQAYWERLHAKYGPALAFFDAGDPEGAARSLKALRYYTGSVDDYARAMTSLYRDFTRAWPMEDA